MARSTAEKPTSSGVEASSTTCRSSRTEPAFQPNRIRIARNSQFSLAARASCRSTTAGRLRTLRGLSWVGSESAISIHPLCIGVGNPELCQNLLLECFHRFSGAVGFVVVADQMQETMDGEMAQMMVERFSLVAGLLAHRLIG